MACRPTVHCLAVKLHLRQSLAVLAPPIILAIGCLAGCDSKPAAPSIILYSSVDEPIALQVVDAFTKKTGIQVQLKLDTEAGKTTGLVRRIRAEKDRPRADVFWSSELFNTIKLAREGLLAEYRPPAADIPDRYRDPDGRWTAFASRARVLIFNTDRVKREEIPASWREVADDRWRGRLAVANPQFGTTGGQFAAMYVLWGEPVYIHYLQKLKGILSGPMLDGNATVARQVGSGNLAMGMTDTDDVYARQERREPVDLTYPDLGDGGTLLIPNSVGLITGAPHGGDGKKLVDFLASEETERILARSDSRNIPVRSKLRDEVGMRLPPETKVSFAEVADAMEPAIRLASEHLAQ
ncbi:MAG TPA: extracellular solute-binding protein [Phycisphaerae bacterium]|nr:extracellular solute-binding protein [Phycisphaerae bacterium]HRY68707.1 extracellular solute-binding protein [Phycisphaerae bacterium]HSA25533.1 extracellular solute-binding protein [Phycisphaerae bacterium]